MGGQRQIRLTIEAHTQLREIFGRKARIYPRRTNSIQAIPVKWLFLDELSHWLKFDFSSMSFLFLNKREFNVPPFLRPERERVFSTCSLLFPRLTVFPCVCMCIHVQLSLSFVYALSSYICLRLPVCVCIWWCIRWVKGIDLQWLISGLLRCLAQGHTYLYQYACEHVVRLAAGPFLFYHCAWL